ncbi:nickel/cobalt transporter [Streptomyces afghaniensis]|uniref:nickel/cobalt transporter n=1 Tax=Streptomyces afghaniensis TaxID=66865 RepID=UPI0027844827|nr:nickel transporter [Streptomyces afghaniensis]MDQ1015694.1 nickel/cobalt exporter [Streptomyces afghaniensis]
MKLPSRAAVVAAPLLVLFCLSPAPTAQAHPLGNFSVNHYDGLRLSHDRIEDTAVVDSAEIPTAQDEEATDTDRDGTISPAEATDRAAERCAQLADRTRISVGGERLAWKVGHSTLTYGKGAAGVPVARLTCILRADADLSRPADVAFTSGADVARTGWKEITAVPGDRVRLAGSSVPSKSPSDVLRHYPRDGDEQPLDVVKAELRTQPGAGWAAPGAPGPAKPDEVPAVQAADRGTVLFPALEHRLTGLTAGRDLTLPVGLLAVLLTLLLGAGHAALPGHAKLAVAACLARRQGGLRAALAVGTTVTATHTAGVLAMGLILTAGGGFAGEQLLGWLGAISGAVIAVLGMVLTVTAVRALRAGRPPARWHHGHSHGHTHSETREHTHAHGHPHPHEDRHGTGHSHGHVDHAHETDSRAGKMPRRTGLPALLGVGLAAGLVPSPSALVVLLGAIALSRTFFGVLLVVGYGLGMALTLTAAGLLLSGGGSRFAALGERRLPSLRRYTRYATVLTALAVLTVGISLTLRNLLAL